VITGNLILVKEVIEYCNGNDEDGAVVMMDFMKAYDRVDRDVMFRVLRKMNFGEDMLNMIETMYEDVEARVEVNGEMSDVMKTGGGVRQGCPLSPYLFICVLELLAISIRQNEGIVGIREPTSGVSTKFSLFADDSALLCGNPKEGLKEARKEVERFEEATAAALHDGKTKILLLGSLRRKDLKNEDFEVKFEIMKEKQVEVYLGDKIGEEVTEKERFKEPEEKMERTAKNWAKLKICYYGKGIVANTLLKAQFNYRAQVNTVTKEQKKAIKDRIRNFVWDSMKPLVAWHKLVQPIKAGGIALIDIDCALDAQKVSILRHMKQKGGQPWP